MAWIEPKTDWVSSDYFNIEDYNRIKNNIAYLKTLTDKLFDGLNWITGKNLIPYPYREKTHVDLGISWTDNGDGTVTANGTNTGTVFSTFVCTMRSGSNFILPAGTYKLTGAPSDSNYYTNYSIIAGYSNEDGNWQPVCDASGTLANMVFSLDNPTQIQVQITVRPGVSVDNITFYPMVRRADIQDDTWEPYYATIPNSTDNLITVFRDKENYLELIYAKEINNIENALETLNLKTYAFNIGETTEYRANGSTPLYSEFNRIESAILLLYNTMISHKEALPRLAFTLGGQKGIRV